MPPDNLLLRVFNDPGLVAGLGIEEWDALLAQARTASLTARLSYRIEDAGAFAALPDRVHTQFAAVRVAAESRRRALEWEVNRLHRVLTRAGYPVLLLKGAAYAIAGLPLARGHSSVDIDIMVPRNRLESIERHLVAHGWELVELNPYDACYYRGWSHELPPLRHRDRGSVLDVHHTILPPLSRLRPDPSAFWPSAIRLCDGSMAFCPTHMVLHVAVHLFQDGEIAGGLGDLVDFDELCRHFGRCPRFWQELVPAAVELGLARPLFYALRYGSLLLATPVPAIVMAAAARAGKPPTPVCATMDPLVRRALIPDLPDYKSPWRWTAQLCLYVALALAAHAAAAAGVASAAQGVGPRLPPYILSPAAPRGGLFPLRCCQ